MTDRRLQAGVSLVELMIAVTIGLVIVLAATLLYVGASGSLRIQDEASRLDDSGRFALESIARLLRIAGYVNWPGDSGGAPIRLAATSAPALEGRDGSRNDTLSLRFFGSTQGAAADGAIVDCLGAPVPRDGNPASRSENVLSVSASGSLMCQATGMATPQPLIDGIDRLQFLYGVDTDGDGIPDHWQRAAQVSDWRAVRSVKLGLLMVAGAGSRQDPDTTVFRLFGPAYSDAADAAVIDTRTLSDAERRRLRRLYTATVAVRNGG
ncbi:MAG: PilW family protein [Burkholderiaceae bacterium]